MHNGTRHDETGRVRWAAARRADTTTLVEVDYDRGTATVVELSDGVARIQIGDVLPGGRFVARLDTTVEAICSVRPVEPPETLPLFEEPVDRPGLAGFGPSSRRAPAAPLQLVADIDDREAA